METITHYCRTTIERASGVDRSTLCIKCSEWMYHCYDGIVELSDSRYFGARSVSKIWGSLLDWHLHKTYALRVCVWMCVCACVFVCVSLRVCLYTCEVVWMCVCGCVCVCACVCLCMCVCVCVRVWKRGVNILERSYLTLLDICLYKLISLNPSTFQWGFRGLFKI